MEGKGKNPEVKSKEPSHQVPEAELQIDYVRASGPGGQKVQKTSSKAQLRWHIGESAMFSDEEKEKIRAAAKGRLNREDEIVISADEQRSQAQNRQEAIARLDRLINEALTPVKARKATKPSRAAKERRLKAKKLTGEKKQLRQKPSVD